MHGSLVNSTPLLAARSGSNWPGWAAFLASSWTWCIGMFLPVLLVRDFGIWGWAAFAVPNVLGAAAMGWVLNSAAASKQLASTHREACALFSGVTIAFHLFFVVAVVAPLATSMAAQAMDLALGGVIAASILMYVLMTRQGGADRALAVVALLISLLAMGWSGLDIARTPEEMPRIMAPFKLDLLWLTPVCFFGFATCPYLDLTFHRARQECDSPRTAFGFGFGVMFLGMMLFTLVYSHAITQPMSLILGSVLFVHMAVQSAFTLAAHARELQHGPGRAAVIAGALTIVAWAALWLLRRGDVIEHLRPGELIYRIFMGFYGLAFPTYVWLVVIPIRGGRSAPNARNVSVLAVSLLLALPMFWMGFVAGRMIWLVPGLAVILLSRLALGKSIPQNSSAG